MNCPRCWKKKKAKVLMIYKNYESTVHKEGVDTFSCPSCNYTLIEVIHE